MEITVFVWGIDAIWLIFTIWVTEIAYKVQGHKCIWQLGIIYIGLTLVYINTFIGCTILNIVTGLVISVRIDRVVDCIAISVNVNWIISTAITIYTWHFIIVTTPSHMLSWRSSLPFVLHIIIVNPCSSTYLLLATHVSPLKYFESTNSTLSLLDRYNCIFAIVRKNCNYDSVVKANFFIQLLKQQLWYSC